MTPHLVEDLKADEGLRLRAYPDPLTKASPWTIGYGHCGLDVHPGLEWTQDHAEQTLKADIAKACGELDRALPWWRSLNDARQDCLVQLAFNMGIGTLLEFKNTLAAIKRGSYATAAENLRVSKWASQVHGRAARIADQMQRGVR
jgi:lysozyme